MRRLTTRSVLVAALVWSSAALAYEGQVRREETDGGVHVPQLTRPPELLSFVEAPYPEAAAREGKTAQVRLLVTLDADGAVVDATIPEPSGDGFDEAAVAAVRQFKFSPAEVDGVPAPIQLEYVYNFALAPAPVEATPPPPPPSTLKGQLLARGSRTRVPAATVRCGDDPAAPEVTSDADGRFSLEVPSAGPCEVRVVANGFQLFKATEALQPGETAEVVYHLLAQAVGYETVVRGARDKKEVVRRTLERQELQRVPGTFGDPVRVIHNMPGVARAPYVSGQLVVRGARANQTGTLLDGVPVPLLFHLGGGPSVINAEFIDRIDFYPGGFGARFGRAVGGMVDVATRKGASDTTHGSAKVDLIDSGFFIETPVTENVSVAAAARRSYIDLLLPLVLPNSPSSGTLFVLPRYWDYQVRADLGPGRGAQRTDGSTFYVMAFGSDDQLKVVATGGGRNRDFQLDFRTMFHRLKGDWTYRSGGFSSTFTPYVGFDLGSGRFGQTRIRADIYSLGGRQDLQLEVTPLLTVRTGFDLLFEHTVGFAELPILSGTQYVPFPGAEPKVEYQSIRRTVNAFDAAVFLEADLKLGALTVTPGLRYSRARLYGQTRVATEPRLWARYTFGGVAALKGSVGLYTQPPEASDMEPPPFGNPGLIHEKAFQASVGYEHRLTDAIDVDVTAYYNRRYDNVVSPGPTVVNEDRSVTRFRLSNDGLGRAYGVELLVRHAVTRNFFGWISYTLGRSETRRRGEADRGYLVTGQDQTHLLTLVGSYRLPDGLELGGRFRYVTGRPFTPLNHRFDLYNGDSNRYARNPGVEPLSARLAAFHQLDVRVDKHFVFRDWTLTVYLDIQNIYNARNVEGQLADFRFREYIDIPGVPFLPVIGVKGAL